MGREKRRKIYREKDKERQIGRSKEMEKKDTESVRKGGVE
jgi:hypothetical protein